MEPVQINPQLKDWLLNMGKEHLIGINKKYSRCLKCRGLDTSPEAHCNCPVNSKEKLKAQAQQLSEQRGKQQ